MRRNLCTCVKTWLCIHMLLSAIYIKYHVHLKKKVSWNKSITFKLILMLVLILVKVSGGQLNSSPRPQQLLNLVLRAKRLNYQMEETERKKQGHQDNLRSILLEIAKNSHLELLKKLSLSMIDWSCCREKWLPNSNMETLDLPTVNKLDT